MLAKHHILYILFQIIIVGRKRARDEKFNVIDEEKLRKIEFFLKKKYIYIKVEQLDRVLG